MREWWRSNSHNAIFLHSSNGFLSQFHILSWGLPHDFCCCCVGCCCCCCCWWWWCSRQSQLVVVVVVVLHQSLHDLCVCARPRATKESMKQNNESNSLLGSKLCVTRMVLHNSNDYGNTPHFALWQTVLFHSLLHWDSTPPTDI